MLIDRVSVIEHDWTVTGTVTQLQPYRGIGSLIGEDGKTYLFRRQGLRDCWFHELSEGASVTFDAGQALEAIGVRLVRPG